MQVGTLIKGFWLEAAGGTLVEYRPGGELLLVFSFHATLSCRHRNRELDPAVRSMAGWAGVRVWDVVVGGCSDDSFVFAARLDARANVDRIADFQPGTEHILLKGSIFAAIGPDLAAGEFHIGRQAGDSGDHILYARASGNLFYDANGSGHGHRTLFARLDKGLDLDAGDFVVI